MKFAYFTVLAILATVEAATALTTIDESNYNVALEKYVTSKAEAVATYGEISEWDVSAVQDMTSSFEKLTDFNEDISNWDTSNVVVMDKMFAGAKNFNQDISKWNVAKVKSMKGMFNEAFKFNQNLNKWDVSSVAVFQQMFDRTSFNGDISRWDTSSANNMMAMFKHNEVFNRDISKWDVSSVSLIGEMFMGCIHFNQDISKWDVSNAMNLEGMFQDTVDFNQNLSKWDVSNNLVFNKLFRGAHSFNGDISKWDTSKGTSMHGMFENFRHSVDISKWDVSKVKNMEEMFKNADMFNSDISKWDVSKLTVMVSMFEGAQRFNQDISKWYVSGFFLEKALLRTCRLRCENYPTFDMKYECKRGENDINICDPCIYPQSESVCSGENGCIWFQKQCRNAAGVNTAVTYSEYTITPLKQVKEVIGYQPLITGPKWNAYKVPGTKWRRTRRGMKKFHSGNSCAIKKRYFDKAKAICESISIPAGENAVYTMVLCSLSELLNGAHRGIIRACNMSRKRVWTSSPCEKGEKNGYYVIRKNGRGKSRCHPLDKKPGNFVTCCRHKMAK